eukprot:2016606-Prymnesium_polylepis.2
MWSSERRVSRLRHLFIVAHVEHDEARFVALRLARAEAVAQLHRLDDRLHERALEHLEHVPP